ncbi:MAG: glycosyltransferase [Planctomycetaceae bacterium]
MSRFQAQDLTILRDSCEEVESTAQRTVRHFDALRSEILTSNPLRNLLRYRTAEIRTWRLETLPQPLKSALLLRGLSRGHCQFRDELGRVRRIGILALAQLTWEWLRDKLREPAQIRLIEQELDQLEHENSPGRAALQPEHSPVYLRSDLCFAIRSGGSVGHIAGVLNQLDQFCGRPQFVTTANIPTVREDLQTHLIWPDDTFASSGELRSLNFNAKFYHDAVDRLAGVQPAFVYQRYSLNNFCGLKLSRQFGVPFVLEYNGSEVWIHRNWGRPLKHESVSERIEALNIRAADLVVVVSQPMHDELVERGFDAERILVNPNGVDPDVYAPTISGSAVRRRLEIEHKTVIGFIGTFGPWHGAELLADAFGQLLETSAELRQRLHLLLIGDGVKMPEVQRQVERYQMADNCTLTGLIPQAEGPEYLAACDVLASPHVPNPDGAPFFGSSNDAAAVHQYSSVYMGENFSTT